MLNHFWAKLPGFSDEVRHTPITGQDPNVTHPAAVCKGPIAYADLGLVDEFETVARFARGAVKVTMTGPHMLAKVAHDEFYGDLAAMMQDLAKVINRNLKDLAAAGCRYAQIDEPLFAVADDQEVKAAVEAINLAIEDVRDMSVMGHICQGNYAVGEDYDGQVGHRYFTGRYPAALITDIAYDALLVEHDMVDAYQGLLGDKRLAVGAVDVQDLRVETPETVAERIRAHSWLAPEQTLITSTCGMNHLPREVAFGKLAAMTQAREILDPEQRLRRVG
jgi:5-methyltetrahydropteroyltriglutamate--homocysteine methyltransferase